MPYSGIIKNNGLFGGPGVGISVVRVVKGG